MDYENFSWITDQLAVGEAPTEQKLKALAKAKVAAVVDIRSEASDNQSLMKDLQLQYFHAVVDDCYPPSLNQLIEIYKFVDPLLDSGKKVFVHCQNGYGRSPLVTAAIMIHRGMTTEEALKLLYEKHPVTTLTAMQKNFILYLEEQLNNL